MDLEKIEQLHIKARELTTSPGVYIMHNNKDEIIYIGKAKNLKNRVSSYFRAVEKHLPKVYAMVSHVEYFETILCSSEFEALVLECSLIKRHSPKYNILLKDDKGYTYLKITKCSYPKLEMARKKENDNALYFGPYMSQFIVTQTIDDTNKLFMLPTCNKNFPADFKKTRPCLNYHIKQCMGVCRGNISENEYNNVINQAIDFIKAGSEASKKMLTEKMQEASDNLDYEEAAKLRDRIKAIERFDQKQKVVFTKTKDCDVIAALKLENDIAISLIKFRNEMLTDKTDFVFSNGEDIESIREDFISTYYMDENHDLPSLIFVDEELNDNDLFEQLLTSRLGKKVEIRKPKVGENTLLIQMAKKNAAEKLSSRNRKRNQNEVQILSDLAKVLNINKTPIYIEAYDISNIGSSTIVAGMTVFENAKPLKSAYRKFNINGLNNPDDYQSMFNVIDRRLNELDNKTQGFDRAPDLILVDGGQNHVSIAKKAMIKHNIDIPIFGMVKDNKHRTRAITSEGNEITISSFKQVFSFITNIQDETHRFAIGFARKKHKNNAITTELINIPGIGENRARALYIKYKTKENMLKAGAEELAKLKGMNINAANNIIKYLQEN